MLLFMMQRGASETFRKCIFPKCLLTSDKYNLDFALHAGGVVGVWWDCSDVGDGSHSSWERDRQISVDVLKPGGFFVEL